MVARRRNAIPGEDGQRDIVDLHGKLPQHAVIPAQAGTQCYRSELWLWVPACAGMTDNEWLKVPVRPVAARLVGAHLAAAERDRAGLGCLVLHRRETAALVRAVAERL